MIGDLCFANKIIKFHILWHAFHDELFNKEPIQKQTFHSEERMATVISWLCHNDCRSGDTKFTIWPKY